MSSFVPTPTRIIHWKCPKCGGETIATERPNPWILTCLPLFGCKRRPVCPKCGTKMIEEKLFY